jgi:hypothetical protein
VGAGEIVLCGVDWKEKKEKAMVFGLLLLLLLLLGEGVKNRVGARFRLGNDLSWFAQLDITQSSCTESGRQREREGERERKPNRVELGRQHGTGIIAGFKEAVRFKNSQSLCYCGDHMHTPKASQQLDPMSCRNGRPQYRMEWTGHNVRM